MSGGNGSGLAIARSKSGEKKPEYQPTEAERRIISDVTTKYQQKDRTKRAYEKTWFVSHAALVGQHYLVWNDINRAFEIPMRSPAHRIRLVINMMLAYWRRTKARLTAHRPGLHVAPATTNEDDVERARLNLHVLESEFERLGFQVVFKEGVGWVLEAGNTIFAFRWNPWAGAPLFEEQPVMDEDPSTGAQVPRVDPATGQPMTQQVPVLDEFGRQLHRGETELEVASPYEFEIDPNATSLDDAEWCMRNSIKKVSWVRENYRRMGKYVQAEDVYVSAFYQKRHKQLVGIYGYSNEAVAGEEREDPKDCVVVHEYWERPSEDHPNGRCVIVAGGVLLHDGPNPYDELLRIGIWFPYVHTGEIRVPGRFWYMATVEQAFPLNKNLNRARSQEVENRQLHGRPKILVPRTAKIRQGSFDAEAGEKIDYNPGPHGERPELIWPQSTAASTQAEIQHTMNDLQNILAWHESSQGIMPSANAPGVAIDKLQQADETSLGETESHLRDAIIRMGRIVLAMANQFWTEERMVRVAGEDTEVAAMKIRGEQLRGEDDLDYYCVRMMPQSTMWRDPQAQRKMVDDLLKMQVINPVDHRAFILKALDQASIEDIFKDDHLDAQWANQENNLMAEGQYSVPRDFENHQIHLQELNRFRKTERYRKLPPEAQKLFDTHAQQHEQLMVMVGQKAMAQQAVVQAPMREAVAPPGKGGSPEPAPSPAA